MNRFGLLGHTLDHSFSPAIHKALGDYAYDLYEKEPEELAEFLADPALQGLNVTIPYKKTVMPYCQSITPQARRIGCVNTLLRQSDGTWHGTNTDYDGFAYLLDSLPVDVAGKHAVILGNGATAQTVHTVLEDRGAASIRHVARRDAIPFSELPALTDTQVLVNTTPVGMYPNCPARLVTLTDLPNLAAVCDVIYNPRRTQLLMDAAALGIPHLDGLPMLVAQAVAASALFQGRTDLWDALPGILKNLRRENENLVLIGMPGSGKSRLGQLLATKMKRPFVDIDEIIADAHGPVDALIDRKGIAHFRAIEKETLRTVGKEHGLVIATGGGAVTEPENAASLKQNGRLYWLQRPLHLLATDGRPLSRGGLSQLQRLEAERTPLYRAFSDCSVVNNDLNATVNTIMEDFYETAHLERSQS